MLRGKEKVAVETGLLALAHNFGIARPRVNCVATPPFAGRENNSPRQLNKMVETSGEISTSR